MGTFIYSSLSTNLLLAPRLPLRRGVAFRAQIRASRGAAMPTSYLADSPCRRAPLRCAVLRRASAGGLDAV